MYDLIIRNGFLMDPANGWIGQRGDIAVYEGRIAEIAERINGGSLQELWADGLTVTPGLIDFHAHFYSGGTNTSLELFQYLSTGVTNAVDAGSAGVSNIESFIGSLSCRAKRNVRLYLNLSSEGLSCLGDHSENIHPDYFNEKKILHVCREYPELIIGLKLRISKEIAESSRTTSFAALRRGVEIAKRCGLPLSVHIPDFQGELKELLQILREGDIFCHVFTPQKGIIENGCVSEEIRKAADRGIILECACGKGHFGHKCAGMALEYGIMPDIISGDFTRKTFHYQPAVSLPYLLSRFLALKMPFHEVLACCTTAPAKKMGMEKEIGCLRTGAKANISAFFRKQEKIVFDDVRHDRIEGTELLVPALTILEGEPVYRNLYF